ncbi:MAG: bifunctional hydroxymethylpyrimidine kinase/phosphomethylpyrimidine kinase [Burkholderiaceae bacterium]|nr:bifunctional hydroxymethylpyrimidine kinase/phosphomethylpyrimidine kinase [Burkholderiaceae bacterium]MCD8537201.1 bifunctional hydroxymethylpyrimidine kinase/phosphomethylpyrimidine kinase [Burkholderiaceae bacterium]MCD8564939.1 bifunctional hydroxymethylpyrimidine kinase/phosphomethylpyrimidine kinase [Burkholderiaceae bacterium]
MIPNVLTIAGVDPSGGAGILADVKAMSALGGYGCAIVAALTAQNTQAVTHIHPVPVDFVGAQIDTLFADVTIHGCKIGMLGQAPVIRIVADKLAKRCPEHVVLDPVMVAKSGDMLLETSAVGELREALLPLATMITPNLPEAGVLLEGRAADSVKEMRQHAERLRSLMNHDGQRWVFLKGGHLPGNETTDLLHDGDVMIEMPGERINTRNTHGTGCTLSAALVTLLAKGLRAQDAASQAKAYLVKAIAESGQLSVGHGHGPVHHFHAFWKTPSTMV